MKGLLAIVVIV